MAIDYLIADPTGNITILVKDDVPAEERYETVHKLFEKVPACEQVGFVVNDNEDSIGLEMMGGEFCGNATLSVAAYRALNDGLELDEQTVVTVHSSGKEEPVSVRITRCADYMDENGRRFPTFVGTLEMDMPELTEFHGYPLVQMDGISHLLVPSDLMTFDDAEENIKGFAHELDVPALGIILNEQADTEGTVRIRPLVYVQGSDTMVWEHGCASGSIAMGYYRYSLDSGNDTTAVKQPGGIILIDIEDGRLYLTGQIRLMK